MGFERRIHVWPAVALALLVSACGERNVTVPSPPPSTYTFGLVMVGPYDDHGWSQAHYDAGNDVLANLPGTRMLYVDSVNAADRPGSTPAQVAEQLVAQGARLVIFSSDDMKDSATAFAAAHPDVFVIMVAGDQVWPAGEAYTPIATMTNIMGRIEFMKMLAGCAAALTTQTGQIGYLGPLINDETRRLAASAFLGARHCWAHELGRDPADLSFTVTWIGFWFNIPGVTLDPTTVADDFFDSGHDVIISGIDTTEALTVAQQRHDAGHAAWALPYNYGGACQQAPAVCLGVPYFNWGPAYRAAIQSAMAGTWASSFQWNPPDWRNINAPDTSAVGFRTGPALDVAAAARVDQMVQDLAGGLNLWTGPLRLQDGSLYLRDGEVATDQQIWYLPQLLAGMAGDSDAD